MTRRRWKASLLLLLLLLPWGRQAAAYSLLTHEQLIDLTWDSTIVPLLLSRYPTLTPAQLEHARAYAYGGCVIQDIGYYPFGDALFSDLTHYVRTGDFVVNLFRNAGNADELAFAVGALSHYIGDSNGHSLATNLAVPVEFPKLEAKYGKVVNYAQGKRQHVRTEFAFDINEVAHHRMAPQRYLRKIGMEVPVKQLSLAYYQTYGLSEDFSGTRGHRINVGAYRFAVRGFIPRIAYAVTLIHRKHEPADSNNPEVMAIRKAVAAVSAENHWDQYRHKAGIGTWTLAGLLLVIPKVGPLSLVAIKGPTPATEAEYVHSVTMSIDSLNRTLRRFTPPPTTKSTAKEAASADTKSDPPPSGELRANTKGQQDVPHQSADPRHPLPNRDLDTGNVVKPGGYPLTDSTYATLLYVLTRQPNVPIPPGIKLDILAYYKDMDAPFATEKEAQTWAQVKVNLATLAGMPTSTELEPFHTYEDDQSSGGSN